MRRRTRKYPWDYDEKGQCEPCQARNHGACVDGGGDPNLCLCGCH